ncbi:MAG: type II toxin-antitoxin system RelE/ParE family toxin [Magnetococcales bacterium]|nr:type II toxin-antitoxin system RelE/ParE family toxin [Magnetococcales bacterium]
MNRLFKTRHFARWLRKSPLSDADLLRAVDEMARGLIDADLGGGVFKKRVAPPGQGKSGGVRILVATKREERWFFVYGFEKNDRANITPGELPALQDLASDLLGLSNARLAADLAEGRLEEISHER